MKRLTLNKSQKKELEERIKRAVENKGFRFVRVEYDDEGFAVVVDEFFRIGVYPIPYDYVEKADRYMDGVLDMMIKGINPRYLSRLENFIDMVVAEKENRKLNRNGRIANP